MSRPLTSLTGYIRKISGIRPASDEIVYYRGHANHALYKLKPSLFREESWKKNEHTMINEIMSSNPYDFRDDKSMFEKLVRMQHHFLPTRLLDVTSNPLMALYFTCCEGNDTNGDILIIRVKKQNVKYSDSDTVSCISNASRLTHQERESIDTSLPPSDFNTSDPILRLLHYIKEEKPYFTDCIKPLHLESILCVKPKMSNLRIASQSGAFLLFGINSILNEKGDSKFRIDRVRVDHSEKSKILNSLESVNIHRGTVYPNIENSSIVIKKRYLSTTV